MTRAQNALTYAAGAVIVSLTIAAFWLSYAHLHSVAAGHGLGMSPERAWAWPATLDLFIVAGELLMLRASLSRSTDGWAIALTVVGSGGSIALNVFGVTGTDPLDYVTAAVPPTAALLAFGALMRQVHGLIGAEVATEVAGTVSEVATRVEPLPVAPATAALPAAPPAPEKRHVICGGAEVYALAVPPAPEAAEVALAEPERLSTAAARAVIEKAHREGLTAREAARLATRSHTYTARVYAALEAAQPIPGQLSIVK